MAKRTLEQQLAKAKQDKAKAEARIRSAASRMREADRRADARRKIIIGGAILGRAAKNPTWAKALRDLVAALPERDRAAFDGWAPPTPEEPKTVGIIIEEAGK